MTGIPPYSKVHLTHSAMRGLVESSRIRHGQRLALVHWENDTRTEVREDLLVVIAPPPLRHREPELETAPARVMVPIDHWRRWAILALVIGAAAVLVAGWILR